ncbi:integrin beta-1-A-like [Amphiura filiformis]|uniref:integrin beta-1-A-like n=1 Tax=Amphiura filiformis TaxID=82378 RepID=UPI003B21C51B
MIFFLHRFYVKPYGLKDALVIATEVICSCECEEKGIPNSDLCSDGNGTFACGVCYCNPNRYGKECECDVESGTGEGYENCRSSNSTLICSGRGECYCGECQCFLRQNPKEVISGPFCECDNFSCDRYEGEICGGPKRGKCICDENTWTSKCQCHKGYAGNACQCPDTNDACMATTGLLCNGFGECDCGKCVCDENSSFRGPTCEDCGICIGDCGVFRECVMCTVFEEGRLSPEECAQCSMLIVVEKKLQIPEGSLQCETLNEANCTVIYYYETLQNGTVLVHVQKHPVCPQATVVKVEPWIIVVAIICAILFIGLLLILLLRLYIYYLDKKEFAEFEKDRKQANWDTSTNPIYKPSTTKHANPMYGKAVQMEYQDDPRPKTEL